MAVVFKILNWLISFLPDDPIQEKFLDAIGFVSSNVNAGMTQEGNNWATAPLVFANYFLPLDTMVLCLNTICVCTVAALLICFGKTLYTWLTNLIGTFT